MTAGQEHGRPPPSRTLQATINSFTRSPGSPVSADNAVAPPLQPHSWCFQYFHTQQTQGCTHSRSPGDRVTNPYLTQLVFWCCQGKCTVPLSLAASLPPTSNTPPIFLSPTLPPSQPIPTFLPPTLLPPQPIPRPYLLSLDFKFEEAGNPPTVYKCICVCEFVHARMHLCPAPAAINAYSYEREVGTLKTWLPVNRGTQ